ncbi:hypothetical protein RUM44_005590 [Polyplax serrata]|uniref:Uncharacterized protein n=1 Tax=Polyplax serrata TaxID=468196 RepID=A0ABR1ADT1_POLSC
MEVMEEGNLLDRVRILLQRDLAYYKQHQAVLQETLCSGVVGGLLDFPRYASFAAVKIVTWWEAQFKSAFQKLSGLSGITSEFHDESERGCGGVVVNLTPSEFIKVVQDTSSQLLEYLHVLSQEALDHADLTVLTGTLGASALIKNTLWCYNEHLDPKAELSLLEVYRNYQEMSEALSERLLDLHCRLLSLYVLQDSDSLSWDYPQPFFEGERGSFVIQMWWLYMQGTRQDLWNTVPPKTAQRVLAGMLNETLTILATRYCQAEPSPARMSLLITDIGNLLSCVNEILPSICNNATELLGFSDSKIHRDIHCKCNQLLLCLILRGCPLPALYKIFKNGLENVAAFGNRIRSIAPWITFVCPELQLSSAGHLTNIPDGFAIMLELKVLVAQPQPNYPLLLHVLTMRNYKVSSLLLRKTSIVANKEKDSSVENELDDESNFKCKGFLCSESGDCKITTSSAHDIISALAVILMNVCTVEDLNRLIVPAFELTEPTWANCLDRHQIWNLRRPPWLSAFVSELETPIRPLVDTLLQAAESDTPIQECVALTLEGLVNLVDVLPSYLFKVAAVLHESIPADIKPVGKSVLLQLLVSVVYGLLIETKKDIAIALGEALCHLKVPKEIMGRLDAAVQNVLDDTELALVSDITVSRILFTRLGRGAMKTLYYYIYENQEWLISALIPGIQVNKAPNKLLYIMFHIGIRPFDQILSGEWKPNYLTMLEKPLSLSRDTTWMHLSRRPEFLDPSRLPKRDKMVVETISSLFINE